MGASGEPRIAAPSYQCPGCGTWHSDPYDPDGAAPWWVIPKRTCGDHRAIYKCAFCPARICIVCYVAHTRQAHPERYGEAPKPTGERRRRYR